MRSPDESSPPAPARDAPAPRGPWAFARAACTGGFSTWGLQLLAGWLAFSLATQVLWARHLGSLTGWSSLPSYWGETLTARDLWELLENAGLKHHWTGPWVVLGGGAALAWFLWAGWRLQAAAAGVPARLEAWVWGFLDALALGAGPLGLLAWLALLGLGALGATGLPGLGWVHWIGASLVRLAFFSALFLHWWLFRLARAGGPGGLGLGSWRRLGGHWALGFRRFWARPWQWLGLVLGGVAARAGLTLVGLMLAWRVGGATPAKVLICLGFQVVAVLANAWLLGWFLRLAALFVAHDDGVRADIQPPVLPDPS